MYEGYFAFGGNEIANNSRALAYLDSAECVPQWYVDDGCDLAPAFGTEYTNPVGDGAAWIDESDMATVDFLGAFLIRVDGMDDSTATVDFMENTSDGGSPGREHLGPKRIVVRLGLTALSREAMAAGMAWLRAAVSTRTCAVHGAACGEADFTFLVDCPVIDPDAEATPDEQRAPYERFLHRVARTTGPTRVRESERNGVYFREVEIAFTAGEPGIFSNPVTVITESVNTQIVSDNPSNIVTRPSAERSAGTVLVRTNRILNPSLEGTGSLPTAAATAISGTNPAPYFTSGRITGEFSASGTWAFRGRIFPNNAAGAAGQAQVLISLDIAVGADAAGLRYSLSMWMKALEWSGGSTAGIVSLRAELRWLNASNVVVGTDVGLEVAPEGVSTVSAVLRPAGATTARLVVRAVLNWVQTSDLRLYADAMLFTSP